MTEEEWLAGNDPEEMWAFAAETGFDRKPRLLLVALYRQLWDYLPHSLSRAAIEVAERYADGLASEDERVEACIAANRQDVLDEASGVTQSGPRSFDVYLLAAQGATDAAGMSHYLGHSFDAVFCCLQTLEEPPQFVAAFLHDIFGNPFRPVRLLPEWRTSTVTALAAQMCASRDFSAMPILADAIQDAGCNSDDILSHCRGGGPHVRGCWVIDLLLAKE